jgi:hypothetical protein
MTEALEAAALIVGLGLIFICALFLVCAAVARRVVLGWK